MNQPSTIPRHTQHRDRREAAATLAYFRIRMRIAQSVRQGSELSGTSLPL